MFLKTCRCGKTQKNFFFDIGEFFIEECCVEAGYDHKGDRVVTKPLPVKYIAEVPEGKTVQEVEDEILSQIKNDAEVLTLVDDAMLDQVEPEIKETRAERKSREKAEKKAAKGT